MAGEHGDFGGAHQRVEHAAVERAEPRALPFPDGAAGLEHGGDQGRAADGARVDGVVGGLQGRPAFGQVGFAEQVGRESLLADRVAEIAVQDPAAPGEVLRGSALNDGRNGRQDA